MPRLGQGPKQSLRSPPPRSHCVVRQSQWCVLPRLQTHLNQAGSCKRVETLKDGQTGFALMSSAAEAQSAIETLNGSFLHGVSIQVDTYNKKGSQVSQS